MSQVLIVGCGVVGAAIAYELCQVPGLEITVLDRQPPAQASTGAALGVLMGAISQKLKGRNLHLRLSSLQKYDQWIPELEERTGRTIPFNRQGILRLCFEGEDLDFWNHLITVRQTQGWKLEMLGHDRLAHDYPQLNLERVIAAVYSPDDRQVDPVALTLALVEAATRKGVTFRFGETVTGVDAASPRCQMVYTSHGNSLSPDWLVIAAGLGSTPLTAQLQPLVELCPVLGQAIQLRLPRSLGTFPAQPVITGEDVHIVPLPSHSSGFDYWVGATVEFPESNQEPVAQESLLREVREKAIALCPALAEGETIRTWSGLRPRPVGRPAPIIEKLPGYDNVILATGHYRNGVLLAPATADRVREMLLPH
jgi:glycine/D-amino acid oxidase-like deaminating enzyme